MFHVMLVLPALILFFVIVAALLSLLVVGVLAVGVGAFGGASAALFVENKAAKRLLLIGFGMLVIIGAACSLPLVAMFAGLPEVFFPFVIVVLFIGVGVMASFGIRFSAKIHNKVGKVVLLVVFSIFLAASAAIAIVTPAAVAALHWAMGGVS